MGRLPESPKEWPGTPFRARIVKPWYGDMAPNWSRHKEGEKLVVIGRSDDLMNVTLDDGVSIIINPWEVWPLEWDTVETFIEKARRELRSVK